MSRRLLRVTKWNLARICVLRDPRWHHFGLRVHGQRSQARAGWHLGQPPRVRTTRARYVVDAGSAGAPPQAGALRPSGLRAFHARSAIVQLRDAAHRLRNGDGRRGPAACGTARRLLRRAASHRVRCAAPASRHGPGPGQRLRPCVLQCPDHTAASPGGSQPVAGHRAPGLGAREVALPADLPRAVDGRCGG